MAKFDFRILLETVQGQKTSYISQSFVDTSVDLVLSASQVEQRIKNSVSCSYQNFIDFSGSDFDTSKTFSDNLILSASLDGGANTGSIDFTATNSEYDRLLRYKFFGEKVCGVLGLPSAQWIYVDQVRFPADEESNVFQGNIDVQTAFISDTLTFANNANINSDIPFYINTGSDRYIKFIDTRGTGNASLIFGYDKDTDSYEINASENTTFNITNLNNLTVDTINAAQLNSTTTTTQNEIITSFRNMVVTGSMIISGSEDKEPLLRVDGDISASGVLSASDLRIDGNSVFGGDITVGGSVTAQQFITQIISTAEGSNTFGNSINDVQTLTGSVNITGSLNLPDNAKINLGDSNDLQIYSDGTDSFISEQGGSGNLKLLTSQLLVKNPADNEVIIRATQNDAVELYYDNSKKLETSDNGIIVTGDITSSANISASGTILGNRFELASGGVVLASDIGDSVLHIGSTNQQILVTGPTQFGSAITASNNISSSKTGSFGEINLPDNKFIKLGDSGDLKIYHDGNHSKIEDSGTGNLILLSNLFQVKNAANNQTMIQANQGGAVKLLHNNSEKFITTTDGINVTGDISASGNAIFDGHITASGNISASGQLFATDLTLNGSGINIINDSGFEILGTGTQIMNIGSQGDLVLLAGSGRTDTADDLHFGSAGVNSQMVLKNGKLGIGTTDAGESLEVVGNISASGFVSASHFSGDGSGLTNITAEWDGTIDGDAQITGSLVLSGTGHITASGNISSSGKLNVNQIEFTKPNSSDANNILFDLSSSVVPEGGFVSSSKVAGLHWDFRNDDFFLYAHESASDSTKVVFELRDNVTNDEFVFWFNDFKGSGSDAFPLAMRGDRFVVNNYYDSRTAYHKDSHNQTNLPSNNVDFLILKSGSLPASQNPLNADELKPLSLLYADVSDSQVTINGDITASGNISSSGTGHFSDLNITHGGTAITFNRAGHEQVTIGQGNADRFFIKNTNDNRNDLVILDSGNFGIGGNDAPTKKLTVEGDISASGDLFIDDIAQVQHITASGDISGSRTSTGSFGMVGIGVARPAADLHINDSGGEATLLLTGPGGNPTNAARLRFSEQSDGNNFIEFDYDGSGNELRITSNTKADIMTFDRNVANGDVGINTRTPVEALDVSGSIRVFGEHGHITASGNISSSHTGSFGKLTIGAPPTMLASQTQLTVAGGEGGDDIASFYRNLSGTGRVNISFSDSDPTIEFFEDVNDKTNSIGSDSTNSNLVFATGSKLKEKEAVVIQNDGGNVGIGNIAPSKKLTIGGDISASGDIFVGGDISASDGTRALQYDVSAHALKSSGATLDINGTDISFNTNDLFIDQSNSNIGINETSPDDKLHINQGDIRIETATNGTQGIRFFESSPGAAVERARIDIDNSSNNDLSIKTYDNDSTQVDRLTIKTSQAATEIGINTTSPDTLLHISGANNVNLLKLDAPKGDFVFKTNSTSGYTSNFLLDDTGLDIGHDSSARALNLKTNNEDRLTILGNGNTGIGTISPNRNLHISSSGVTRVQIDGKDGSNARLHFAEGGNDRMNIGFSTSDKYFDFYDGENAFIKFFSGSNDANTFVVSGSKVGIGTSNPVSALEVEQGDIRIDIANNGTQALRFSNNNVTKAQIQYVDSDEKLHILTNGSAKAISVDNSQNVGIKVDSPTEVLDVNGNIKARDKISSTTFVSGFRGNGFRIETGSSGTLFTVDDLTVRGTMNVFELLIHQIRATNGSLFVSNTGKILTASLSTVDNHYSMSFDTGSGYGHSFLVGDLVRAQRFVPDTNGSGSQVFKSDLHIVSVNGTGSAIGVLSASIDEQHPLSQSAPQPGYEYVRIGSTSSPDRQGSIYLTADDDNAPFIDVADGITSHSHFNTAGKTKVRIGKLDGITTANPSFGTLEKYGFYASGSAYLEGSINATAGEIGGFSIDSSSISSSNNNLQLFSNGVISGSDVFFDGGKIAGFDFNGNELSSVNFKLNSTNKTLQLGTVEDFNKDGTNVGLFVDGDDGQFFVGKENGDLIHFDGANIFLTSSNFNIQAGGTSIATNDFELSASNLELSSTQASMSLGTGKILLQGASNPFIDIGSSNAIRLFAGTTDNFIRVSSGVSAKTNLSQYSDTSKTGIVFGIVGGGVTKFGMTNDANNHFQFDDNGIQIKATNATLSGSSVEILTPKFFFGDKSTSFISSSTSQIEISSSAFHLQNNGQVTGSKVLFDGGTIGGFEIDTNNLKSTDENIILNSNNKKFSIGSSTFGGHGVQFEFNGGSPKLHLGRNGHSGIRFEGSQLQISSSKVDISGSDVSIQSPNVFLGQGTTNFISASSGKLEISSSNFHLRNGNITASNVDLSGKITATSGQFSGDIIATHINTDSGSIGGFTIDGTQIKKLDSDGGIVIDGGPTPNINVRTGSGASTIRTMMGEVSLDRFGFFGFDEGGVDKLFELSNEEQQIAGFKFTQTELAKNNITMSNANGGKITLNQGSIFLSGSGEGQFADGKMSFDKDGNLTLTDAVLSLPVTQPPSEFFDVANSKFVCLISGSNGAVDAGMNFGTFEDETTITILGTGSSDDINRPIKETIFVQHKFSSGSIASSSLNFGDIIEANKPISLVESADGVGSKGKEATPLNFASKQFLTFGDRNHPVQVMMYSPFAAGSVTMSVENVGTDNPGGGTFVPFISASIEADGTLDLRSSGSLDSGENIVTLIESTVPIVAQSVGTKDNDNDDSTVLMPLDSVILNVDSETDRRLRLDSTTTVKPFTAVTSSVAGTALVTPGEESKAFMKVFTSSNAALMQYHLTGDGDGTDAAQGIGTNTIGNRYIIPHAVGGVQILSTEAAIISCSQMNNDGTLTPFFAVNHSAATIESPLGFSTGSVMGGFEVGAMDTQNISKSLSSKGLYIEGTGNFGLRTNTIGDDEYTPLGFRSGVSTSYNQNVRYFFEPSNTSVITGDRIQTGKIQSNNLSTTVGSEFNLNDGTFKLGGTSNPDLEFDGTTLIISGTVSSSVGNIGGFTIDNHSLTSEGIEINNSTQNIFISSSNFKVDHTGSITASNVDLSGKITATSGQFNGDIVATHINTTSGSIGGFTLGTTAISSSHLVLSSSTTATDFVISASNFNVKAGGQITASNILAEGGKVGGFKISASEISSSGLLLKSTGQITASAVSMSGTIVTDDIDATGGTIGGFTLESDTLHNGRATQNNSQILIISGAFAESSPRPDGGGKTLQIGNIKDFGQLTNTPLLGVSTDRFGLRFGRGVSANNANDEKIFVEFSNHQNLIAGFTFDEQKIITSGSDAQTTGLELNSELGVIGHGDITNREFETHNGQFRFTEDSISTTGGNGVTYDNSTQQPLATDFGTGTNNSIGNQGGTE